VTGSVHFSIEKTENFQRSFKKLAKFQGKQVLDLVATALEALMKNPYPIKARDEPLPGSFRLPEEWTFHKLEIRVGKGGSGQVRLMYLVNEREFIIKPLWIYNHEQFAKRPPDKDLANVIQEALDE
jgi:mRNA-degrading endonuclease YafQ of YafQ-DinJ toxin-antitoxin module